MNVFIFSTALILLSSFLCTEGIFSGGTVAVSGAGLLVAALGVKALAGFGLLAASAKGRRRGGRRSHGKSRYGRSAEEPMDIAEILNEASFDDASDCAKKMVCLVHAKAFNSLDQVEQGIYQLFGTNDAIDVSKDTVQFDLAAMVGRKGGNCKKVYSRCEMTNVELLKAIRQ